MSDNSWYERGEWPPSGFKVEAMVLAENISKRYEKGAIINYVRTPHNYKAAIFESENGELFVIQERSDFRPIKTERELAINLLVEEIFGYYGDPKSAEAYIGIANYLYDAGYRKTTPD